MADTVDDYSAGVREEIALTLEVTPPGEWAELAFCPGPFGCPCLVPFDELAPDGRSACDGCRVIHLYRPA